jgi:hypothetical protein
LYASVGLLYFADNSNVFVVVRYHRIPPSNVNTPYALKELGTRAGGETSSSRFRSKWRQVNYIRRFNIMKLDLMKNYTKIVDGFGGADTPRFPGGGLRGFV